jgi:hypothetical protein
MKLPTDRKTFLKGDDHSFVQSGHACPVHIFDGTTLCKLQIWSESDWLELPIDERPFRHTHVPGLGWLCAVPLREMD